MNDKTEIRKAIDQFVVAYNTADLEAVMGYYTDDLVKTRQGGASERKSETAARIADVFANYETRVDVTNDEIVVDRDLAFTRGTFTVSLLPRSGGDTVRLTRRYLEIWRKENGRWLVARTMDNAE